MTYEYLAIAAPTRGEKAKGAKTQAERYAVALSATINEMASEGWEYLRAETLPAEERSGLTGRTTVFHNLLVFRRATEADAAQSAAAPVTTATEAPAPAPTPRPEPAPAAPKETAAKDAEVTPAAEPAKAPEAPAAKTASPVFSQPMTSADETNRLGPAKR